MADIKRVNYFTHQFLVEKDFDDEQDYHIEMRRRHNRVNHFWGVAEGLEVNKTKDKEVTVSSGTAIDEDGQEIVLLEATQLDLTAFAADTDVYIIISYQEIFDEADHYTSGEVDDYTRTAERPKLESSTDIPTPLPGNGLLITLACVHLGASGNVDDTIDGTMRKPAGSKVAPGSVGTNELANNAATTAKIADNSVTAAKIANGQVGASELAEHSITNSKLDKNAVNAANILDGSVGTAELGKNAVTTAKIADNSVTAAKIANGQVGASELAEHSITNSKLDKNAVNAANILDGSVGTAELAEGSVSIQKLKTLLRKEGAVSILANGEISVSCFSVPLTQQRGESLLIDAYSKTDGAIFEWRKGSYTKGKDVFQSVYFRNRSRLTISITYKIYQISWT